MSRFLVIVVLFFTGCLASNAQEKDSLLILETESTWTSETFHFPLGFAPDLNFEGTEDARFPKGWRKQDSSEFWSYAFAWYIKLSKEMTERELEESIKLYFDGLMAAVNKDTSFILPKTTALFVQNEISNSGYGHKGKVTIFDAFSTQKPMTLNVMVDQYYCQKKRKSIVLFKFSPSQFGTDIWRTLEQIRPQVDVCE